MLATQNSLRDVLPGSRWCSPPFLRMNARLDRVSESDTGVREALSLQAGFMTTPCVISNVKGALNFDLWRGYCIRAAHDFGNAVRLCRMVLRTHQPWIVLEFSNPLGICSFSRCLALTACNSFLRPVVAVVVHGTGCFAVASSR